MKESLERKTEELERSLAMMRATLESTNDGILVTDVEGRIVTCNDKYLEMWGLSREAVEGGVHSPLIEGAAFRFRDPEQFVRRIEEIYRTSPSESHDLVECIDGRLVERVSRIQFVRGQNIGRVWSFRDVTDRKRIEEALRDEARILQLLKETGALLSSTLDLEPLLQSVTDIGTRLSGAQFGAFFHTATHRDGGSFMIYTLSGAPRAAFEKFGNPRATPLFGPTFRGEASVRCDDVRRDPRYGRWGPYHGMPEGHLPVRSYLAVPVVSRSGEVIGGLFFGHPEPGIFTERSERLVEGLASQAAIAIDNARLYESVKWAAEERERLLRAEQAARAEAERTNLLKDEFLATISHELRTPLNAILGWAEVLQSDPSPATLAQALDIICRNARAQTQLIEELLDSSRIVSGKMRLDLQKMDVTGIVDAALASIRPSTETKDIRLRRIVQPGVGSIYADPGRMQQVVWNLLSNAVKFTPTGGEIAVSLRREGAQVEIMVRDSGIGISRDFLPRIFEQFTQFDSSTSRQYQGLGIGLAIVKKVVELHGGLVTATSEGKGRGSTFVVRLPVAPISTGARPRTPRSTDGNQDVQVPGVKVLVIDDEPDARELIRRILVRCRAEVTTAASADEGLEMLAGFKPDIIISDIGMPDKDGYQFIRELRGRFELEAAAIPAIALTAFARSEDRSRALAAGYQTHMSKPVEAARLAATVAGMVRRIGTEPPLP